MAKKNKQQTEQNKKITQQELINKIAKQTRYSPKDVRNILQAFKENLFKTLSQGKEVAFSPIGAFKIKEMKAHRALDVITFNQTKKKKYIIHPAHKTVKFRFYDGCRKAIKKVLN